MKIVRKLRRALCRCFDRRTAIRLFLDSIEARSRCFVYAITGDIRRKRWLAEDAGIHYQRCDAGGAKLFANEGDLSTFCVECTDK